MLKTLFPTQGKSNCVIFSNNDFDIVKYSVKDLKEMYTIKNWSKNRPPDNIRVIKIKQYYCDNDIVFIDGTISAWLKNGELHVYDGIHRLQAALACEHHIYAIVKILKLKGEKHVVEDFKRINSSVSIPYLYLEEKNELKINVCESVMKQMCESFSSCVSSSRNPWKCNFNRDNFIENILSKLNIDFERPNIDKIIFQAILGINEKAKKYVLSNKIECFKKCHYNNFYIMYFTSETIISEVENSTLLM